MAPKIRRGRTLAAVILLAVFGLSACSGTTTTSSVPPSTAPSAATTVSTPTGQKPSSQPDESSNRAANLASIIAKLRNKGFPIVSNGHLNDDAYGGMQADVQFEGCEPETVFVYENEGGVGIESMYEFQGMTDPPDDPTNDWTVCGNTLGKSYGALLKKQGFKVIKNPRPQGSAGGTWTTVKLAGCDRKLTMRMGYTTPLSLFPETIEGGEFTSPPTNKKLIKRLCDADDE